MQASRPVWELVPNLDGVYAGGTIVDGNDVEGDGHEQ